MSKYELLFIIQNELSEEQKDTVIKKVQTIIEKNGGSVANVDKWGTKRLAYAINYKSEGYYVLINFETAASTAKAIKDVLNITEGIVRFMIVAK